MGSKVRRVYETTRSERYSYWSYFIGQNLIYWMVTNYLMMYYTDYLYIAPLSVSILMLVSKVWDAVNDPLFGMVVDRVHFKKGKFIPWIRYGTILLPLVTVLLFFVNSKAAMPVKITLAALGYLLWDLFYTISDVPIYALSTVMTKNIGERNTIISYARLAASLGGVLVSVVVAPMVQRMGYLIPALVIAGAAYLTMLPVCKFAKERYGRYQEDSDKRQDNKASAREMFSYIRGNKPLLIIFTAISIYEVFRVNLGMYIAKYCLGSLDYVTITTLVTILPGAAVYIVVPVLLKRFDKITLYRSALIANVFLGIVAYLIGYHAIVPYMILQAVRAFVGSIPSLLMFTFAPDCVEYGNYVTGYRKEGVSFALQTFTAKFTAAISTALAGVVLAIMKYDGSLKIQPPSIAKQFWEYSCWVPIVGALISLPVFYCYRLKDKQIQIMAECNAQKITKAQAQEMLSALEQKQQKSKKKVS